MNEDGFAFPDRRYHFTVLPFSFPTRAFAFRSGSQPAEPFWNVGLPPRKPRPAFHKRLLAGQRSIAARKTCSAIEQKGVKKGNDEQAKKVRP